MHHIRCGNIKIHANIKCKNIQKNISHREIGGCEQNSAMLVNIERFSFITWLKVILR